MASATNTKRSKKQNTPEFSVDELLSLRLIAQGLGDQKAKSVSALMKRMGAVQAQDFEMSKWAFGIRLHNSTKTQIENAIDRGTLLRTHALRPTWHLVAKDDIRWLLNLNAERIRRSMQGRNRQLKLSAGDFAKSNKLLKRITAKKDRTREEIVDAMKEVGLNTSEYRVGHLLLEAELNGIISSGKTHKAKQTYAALDRRAPKQKKLSREAGIHKLALCYFAGHGPATAEDFAWWAGLTLNEAKTAVESLPKSYEACSCEGDLYYFRKMKKANVSEQALLLPAFDEYTIAYRNRSASVEKKFAKKTLSTNGIFYPLIVINGKIVGLWKKKIEKDKLIVELAPFGKISGPQKDLIHQAARRLADFLELEKFTVTLKASGAEK